MDIRSTRLCAIRMFHRNYTRTAVKVMMMIASLKKLKAFTALQSLPALLWLLRSG